MTTNIQQAVKGIVEATTILSPTAFVFCGENYPVFPVTAQGLPGFPNHPLPSNPLVRTLQSVLYARCYSRRLEDGAPPNTALVSGWDAGFVQQMSAANQTQSRWEGGWTIYAAMPTGQVSLIKGDRQRSAVPGEFIYSGPPGVGPQTGAIVSVQAARESTTAQPGFYFVYGETLSDMWDDHALLRFYFHASSAGAPELIAYVTSNLNRYQVPFRMKALNHPVAYQRTDAIVLYVAKRYHDICVRVVRQLPSTVRAGLRPDIPLFTERVVEGVGLAEEPNTGESFGMHRCRMVAEGIVNAWMKGDQTTEGCRSEIAECFRQNGFDLERPSLAPGSVELPQVSEEVNFSYA